MTSDTPSDSSHLSTLCIHAGRRPSSEDSSVIMPIHQTSTFVPSEADHALVKAGKVAESRFYSRYGNPTVAALERRLAAIEGAQAARCFASGNGAMHASIMALALPGGHVLAARNLYGGTRSILERCLSQAGGSVSYVDFDDEAQVRRELRAETRVLLVESMANPTLEVTDVPRLVELAKTCGARLVVDATFVTPVLQRPLSMGADLVLHSASKYLGGHSDLIAGVVAGSEEIIERITPWRTDAGANLDPNTAFLIDRGLKTLVLRMRAHCTGAEALAKHLRDHPRVTRVIHPSFEDFVHRERARRVLGGTGGMLFFTIEGDDESAARVLKRLRVATPAPSLGGVETLVSQPARTSHASMSEEQRSALGIPPGSIRVSVGIEDPGDLMADFDQALE